MVRTQDSTPPIVASCESTFVCLYVGDFIKSKMYTSETFVIIIWSMKNGRHDQPRPVLYTSVGSAVAKGKDSPES